MQKRSYRNKVIDNAIRNMLHMSEDQLRDAKNHLLHMEWDGNLGPEPDDFNTLPDMNLMIRHIIRMRPTKYGCYIKPLLDAVEVFLPEGSQSVQAQQHRL